MAGIQTATAPAARTSYTNSALLAIGTGTDTVRALYDSAQTSYADSAPTNITYQLVRNTCSAAPAPVT